MLAHKNNAYFNIKKTFFSIVNNVESIRSQQFTVFSSPTQIVFMRSNVRFSRLEKLTISLIPGLDSLSSNVKIRRLICQK